MLTCRAWSNGSRLAMTRLQPKDLANILGLDSLDILYLGMTDFAKYIATDDIGPTVYCREQHGVIAAYDEPVSALVDDWEGKFTSLGFLCCLL